MRCTRSRRLSYKPPTELATRVSPSSGGVLDATRATTRRPRRAEDPSRAAPMGAALSAGTARTRDPTPAGTATRAPPPSPRVSRREPPSGGRSPAPRPRRTRRSPTFSRAFDFAKVRCGARDRCARACNAPRAPHPFKATLIRPLGPRHRQVSEGTRSDAVGDVCANLRVFQDYFSMSGEGSRTSRAKTPLSRRPSPR